MESSNQQPIPLRHPADNDPTRQGLSTSQNQPGPSLGEPGRGPRNNPRTFYLFCPIKPGNTYFEGGMDELLKHMHDQIFNLVLNSFVASTWRDETIMPQNLELILSRCWLPPCIPSLVCQNEGECPGLTKINSFAVNATK